MNYHQAISYLKKNRIFNLYLLAGKELLLKEHFLKVLKNRIFQNGNIPSMNCKNFYGGDFKTESVSNFLRTNSFFGSRKVAVIKDYFKIKPAQRKRIKDVIEKLVEGSSNKNILVIMSDEIKEDPLLNLIKKRGMVVEFSVPDFETLVKWVRNGVENKGKKIEEEAIYLLLSHRGDELLSIKNEIDKLVIYSEDRNLITTQIVAELLGLKKGVTIFDLLDAVKKKDKKRALQVIREITLKEPLPKIMFSMENEIKRLLIAKIFMERGLDYNTVKRKMGLSTHVLHEILVHLPNFSKIELLSMLKELYKVNISLRENYTLGILPLEVFIERFMHKNN